MICNMGLDKPPGWANGEYLTIRRHVIDWRAVGEVHRVAIDDAVDRVADRQPPSRLDYVRSFRVSLYRGSGCERVSLMSFVREALFRRAICLRR
jgi:hypothetical protein